MPANAEFEAILGHCFNDPKLLITALTHRSYGNEKGVEDNERLEFLGDTIVNCVTSVLLMSTFEEATEGHLTGLRQQLVNTEHLAELGRKMQIGLFLRLGKGERRSGGHEKASILANAVEAVFGALYLDDGFDNAYEVLEHWMIGSIVPLVRGGALEHEDLWKAPRNRLQEISLQRWKSTPMYRVDRTGKGLKKAFVARVEVASRVSALGRGTTKKEALQSAAVAALSILEEE
jgi:ribonuclease-3